MKLKPKIKVSLEEGYELKISHIQARLHKNGFISISFEYKSDSELKHLSVHYTSISNSSAALALKSHDSDTILEVELNSGDYEPIYYENQGYGGVAWFGPKGWRAFEESECFG